MSKKSTLEVHAGSAYPVVLTETVNGHLIEVMQVTERNYYALIDSSAARARNFTRRDMALHFARLDAHKLPSFKVVDASNELIQAFQTREEAETFARGIVGDAYGTHQILFILSPEGHRLSHVALNIGLSMKAKRPVVSIGS